MLSKRLRRTAAGIWQGKGGPFFLSSTVGGEIGCVGADEVRMAAGLRGLIVVVANLARELAIARNDATGHRSRGSRSNHEDGETQAARRKKAFGRGLGFGEGSGKEEEGRMK